MVDDKSTHAPADEPQPDTAVSPSGEASDTPKRTSVWRGAVRVIGEVAVNLLIGGLPFFAAGVFWLSAGDLVSQTTGWARAAPWAVILVGSVIVMVGFFVSLISRPRLSLLPGERILAMRHPSMMPPFARIALGVPFLAFAGWMLWRTQLPYIYPFLSFMFGGYLYIRGVATYWINHHTVYYATNRRVVWMYRFIWLDSDELTLNSIISVSPTRSFFQILTGRGSFRVSGGIGSRHKVHMKEIDNPDPMANAIREVAMPPGQ